MMRLEGALGVIQWGREGSRIGQRLNCGAVVTWSLLEGALELG